MEEALSFLGTYLVNHVFKAVLRQIPFAVILVVSACVLLFVLLRRLYVVWHMIALRLLLVSAALTCILLMGASKMSANCDSGWTYYEETMRCYKLTRALKFYEAQWACSGQGGRLAVVNSKLENSVVIDLCSAYPQEQFWIGLHNRQHSDQWTWVDGSKLRYRNWHVQQQNADATRTRVDSRCDSVWHGCSVDRSCGIVSMVDSSYGQWMDVACDSKYPAVCEKPVKTVVIKAVHRMLRSDASERKLLE